MTSARIERVVAALGEMDKPAMQDTIVPLMRHVLAREYGWSYRETNALTLKEANQAMLLVGEDLERRNNGV